MLFLKNIVSAFFDILYFNFVRIIFSFYLSALYGSPLIYNIVQFIRQLTEPFLAPFRRLVPPLESAVGVT